MGEVSSLSLSLSLSLSFSTRFTRFSSLRLSFWLLLLLYLLLQKKQNKNEGEKKKKDGKGGDKKEDGGLITVVLKVDLHCEGCGSKVVKYVKGLEGMLAAYSFCRRFHCFCF